MSDGACQHAAMDATGVMKTTGVELHSGCCGENVRHSVLGEADHRPNTTQPAHLPSACHLDAALIVVSMKGLSVEGKDVRMTTTRKKAVQTLPEIETSAESDGAGKIVPSARKAVSGVNVNESRKRKLRRSVSVISKFRKTGKTIVPRNETVELRSGRNSRHAVWKSVQEEECVKTRADHGQWCVEGSPSIADEHSDKTLSSKMHTSNRSNRTSSSVKPDDSHGQDVSSRHVQISEEYPTDIFVDFMQATQNPSAGLSTTRKQQLVKHTKGFLQSHQINGSRPALKLQQSANEHANQTCQRNHGRDVIWAENNEDLEHSGDTAEGSTGISIPENQGHSGYSGNLFMASKEASNNRIREHFQRRTNPSPTRFVDDWTTDDSDEDLEEETDLEEEEEKEERDWNNNAGHNDERLFSSAHIKGDGQEQYDLLSFNSSLDCLVMRLEESKFQNVEAGSAYPTGDLKNLIVSLNKGLAEYREQAKFTHNRLNDLLQTLSTLRKTLCAKVTASLNQETGQSVEEKNLQAQLSEVAVIMAEALSQVTEAQEMTAQAQEKAIQDRLIAQQAAEEAERIQQELDRQAQIERKRKLSEERRREEEERKRQQEEEERRLAEEERKKEELFKKQQEAHSQSPDKESSSMHMEDWATYVYQSQDDHSESSEIHCIIRANPAVYQQSDIKCFVIPPYGVPIFYKEQEELVSKIVTIDCMVPKQSGTGVKASQSNPMTPFFLALPCLGRMPPSREPVMKGFRHGFWEEMVTTEVTFDNYKEYKFAQAELTQNFSAVFVMSRFKRDFLTIPFSKRVQKVTSSYDPRAMMTIKGGTFEADQNLVLQLQPVESTSVSEFRSADLRWKRLLASSPVLHMDWGENVVFKEPIRMCLPCPPNPAKAKKMAQAKKQREDQKTQKAAALNQDEAKPTAKKVFPVATAAATDTAGDGPQSRRMVTKWYMGQYGLSDDDEHDQLSLITYMYGKWIPASDIEVTQATADIVTFTLEAPIERLMVLRLLLDVSEDTMKQLPLALMEHLNRRSINVFVKQHHDDPYSVICHVAPTWNVERVLKSLKTEGYTDGPDKAMTTSVNEGDTFTLIMQGNLKIHRLDKESKDAIRDRFSSTCEAPSMDTTSTRRRSTWVSKGNPWEPRGSTWGDPSARGTWDPKGTHLGVGDQKTSRWADGTPRGILDPIVFCSNLPNFVIFTVDEVDKYLQRDFETFRGALQILRSSRCQTLKPIKKAGGLENPSQMSKPEVICIFYVDIPKDHLEVDPVHKRAPVRVPSNEMLSNLQIQSVADELGDEWQALASKLNLQKARIQAIVRSQIANRCEENVKYEMLLTWFKRCPHAADKVTILANALHSVGRKDLAMQLRGQRSSVE